MSFHRVAIVDGRPAIYRRYLGVGSCLSRTFDGILTALRGNIVDGTVNAATVALPLNPPPALRAVCQLRVTCGRGNHSSSQLHFALHNLHFTFHISQLTTLLLSNGVLRCAERR